ncbi:hypothetical protein HW115_19440 [Verrucomicrobiaceae bacterium N1E253]|uniref:Uncharacterized protein n=1 Tax=Oceaniferula marina TaxID=2748318 RepID=A0A851GL59_9BACT|nr:hypothetical protein [Oceaniferula marina]NWK57802.1 hypothetical protein [Oceaniferula marina]
MQKMRMLIQMFIFTSVLLCSAEALDWKNRYKAFNSEAPSKELEPIMVKAFKTKLINLEIKDSRFVEALDKLRLALRTADDDMRISTIVRGGDSKVKVNITKGTIAFGDALDQICVQAGYKWDFPPHGKLTITRIKN